MASLFTHLLRQGREHQEIKVAITIAVRGPQRQAKVENIVDCFIFRLNDKVWLGATRYPSTTLAKVNVDSTIVDLRVVVIQSR